MKDQGPMTARCGVPAGISFDIPELMIVQAWAEFHEIRMVIELDYSVEGEEYEEVLALYKKGSVARRWLVWRSQAEVVVQPLIGRSRRFESIAEALESLSPAEEAPLEVPPRRPRARRRVTQ